MILHLEFTVPQLAAAKRGDLEKALPELLRAHRLGHHLVVIPRAEALWLRGNVHFSPADAALLSDISQEYTQTADLVRRAARYVAIVPAPHKDQAGQRVEIGLGELKPYILERPILLVEDANTDIGLFSIIFEAMRKALNVGPLNWEPEHGGGDRLPVVFQSKVTDRRVVCAIIDSDWSAPRTEEPSKAKQLRKISAEMGWPHAHIVVLTCREAENLIPLDIVAQLDSAQAKKTKQSVQVLRTISVAEDKARVHAHQRLWMYFDIKEGMHGSKWAELKQDEVEWLRAKAKQVALSLEETSIDGFGDKVVTQLLSDNKLRSDLGKAVVTRSWLDCFASSFVELLWICAARNPKFT